MIKQKPPKPRKCGYSKCRCEFTPQRMGQKVCSPLCGIGLAREQREKKERKEHREKKVKAMTRRDWLKKAQAAFNSYIRKRDEGKPCISCQRMHKGQMQAGHYLSVGAHGALRFTEANCHSQCVPCNDHLSGNIVKYRPNLISKIGLDQVEWLEGPHEPKKWTIDELQEIHRVYGEKLKGLRNN